MKDGFDQPSHTLMVMHVTHVMFLGVELKTCRYEHGRVTPEIPHLNLKKSRLTILFFPFSAKWNKVKKYGCQTFMYFIIRVKEILLSSVVDSSPFVLYWSSSVLPLRMTLYVPRRSSTTYRQIYSYSGVNSLNKVEYVNYSYT